MQQSKLEQILAFHRSRAAADERDLDSLMETAIAAPAPRDFTAALRAPELSVIAEIKRRSPSAGDLSPDLEPSTMASDYERGGAACISVLTDEKFFGGSVADLQTARASVTLPVLRKDFTVDARDIVDARLMGADAVLLIVAALSNDELAFFAEVARRLSLTALFEVHDAFEAQRALAVGAEVVGINARNLHTFEIDRDLPEKLIEVIRGRISVAESGIRDAADAHRLAAAGFDAILVGTSVVTANGPSAAVRDLIGTRH